MTRVFFLGLEGVRGGMCRDRGLVMMGVVSDGGKDRRAERYVRFVPGKGTRSCGINLRLNVSPFAPAHSSERLRKLTGRVVAEQILFRASVCAVYSIEDETPSHCYIAKYQDQYYVDLCQ
jgi:hypothetical protein